jgi:predicted HNH restriction endonuclease
MVEGRPKLMQHLRRERAAGLASAKKASFIREHGKLFCELCSMDPVATYGEFDGPACIEVHHHSIQVENMGENHRTKLKDLQCLCANCHRIVHRQLKEALIRMSTGTVD